MRWPLRFSQTDKCMRLTRAPLPASRASPAALPAFADSARSDLDRDAVLERLGRQLPRRHDRHDPDDALWPSDRGPEARFHASPAGSHCRRQGRLPRRFDGRPVGHARAGSAME